MADARGAAVAARYQEHRRNRLPGNREASRCPGRQRLLLRSRRGRIRSAHGGNVTRQLYGTGGVDRRPRLSALLLLTTRPPARVFWRRHPLRDERRLARPAAVGEAAWAAHRSELCGGGQFAACSARVDVTKR